MIVELLLGAVAIGLAIDNLRLRRQRRRTALPSNQVAGVLLPEPDDPRWKNVLQDFSTTRGEPLKPQGAMRMGRIIVSQDGWVYVQPEVGTTTAIPDSQSYGRSVWAAYNSRKALDSMLEAT